jgi:hypothetical protein
VGIGSAVDVHDVQRLGAHHAPVQAAFGHFDGLLDSFDRLRSLQHFRFFTRQCSSTLPW